MGASREMRVHARSLGPATRDGAHCLSLPAGKAHHQTRTALTKRGYRASDFLTRTADTPFTGIATTGQLCAGPLWGLRSQASRYVVERGTTVITVAGTTVPLPEYVHPASTPPADTGVHAGRLGLTCWVSVGGADALTLFGILIK